jgi:CBS domain containing-hemolysin-like protein
MDDDQSTEKAVEPPSDLEPAPNTSANGNRPHGLLSRLRALFSNGQDASLRESLEDVIEQHGSENGDSGLKPEARSRMINLLEFEDLRVDDVMVPRADIIAVGEDVTIRELLQIFIEANHSRLPVFRETLDDPIGMVHVKDLMRWMSDRGGAKRRKSTSKDETGAKTTKSSPAMVLNDKDIAVTIGRARLVRDLLFVPPSMPAGDLLIKMQATRQHMAIVVDEYGGTDGLLTIEDLVEEIVGDIADEHDNADEVLVEAGEGGTYIADARAAIEDVEKLLQVDLLPDDMDEDADTLGGFIFFMLGRVPTRGELIKHESGIEFEILGADPRRVRKLKIHARGKPAEAPRKRQPAQG